MDRIFALICDSQGTIIKIIKDEYSHQDLNVAKNLYNFFYNTDRNVISELLDEINKNRVVLGKKVHIDKSKPEEYLYISAGYLDSKILMLGGISLSILNLKFYEEIIKINNELLNALRSSYKNQQHSLPFDISDEGRMLYNEIAMLNNELVNIQRELNKEIARRKAAELELKIGKELLDGVINTSNDAIFADEAIRDEKGKIIDFRFKMINSSAEKLLRRKAEDLIGKTMLSEYPGNLEDGLFQKYVEVVETGKMLDTEHFYKHENFEHWFRIVAIKFGDGFTATISDITNRKLQEIKLKELNASKDRFFSIISHDLRNPISAFKQLTEMLVTDFHDFTEQEKQEALKAMMTSSKNLYELLDKLLLWSRTQTGKIKLNPEKVYISLITNIVFETNAQQANNKSISLVNNVPSSLFAFADVNMLDTIIRNLVSNAIKFTPKGGAITVSGKDFSDYIEIAVQDTGIGMSKELLDKLFKIDEQHSRRGTEDEPGTGLGLILCKEFVEANRGKIWVESQEGVGTKFSFTLPKY